MPRLLSISPALAALSLATAAFGQVSAPPEAAGDSGDWTDPPREAPPAAAAPVPSPTPQGPPPASEVPGAPVREPLASEPTARAPEVSAPSGAERRPGAAGAADREVMIWFRPEIGRPPEVSLALIAHGGLGVHGEGEPLESFAVGGLRLRSTVSFIEFGAIGEVSELPGEYLVHAGGFVGAFVPLRGWIDLDGSLGFGVRRYLECPDSNCSLDEEFTTPALTLRFGISDRFGPRLGGRVGAELFASVDLDKKSAPWVIPPSPTRPNGLRGTDHFGGVSAGLAVTLGLDWIPVGKVR